jgi:hypothetical protein
VLIFIHFEMILTLSEQYFPLINENQSDDFFSPQSHNPAETPRLKNPRCGERAAKDDETACTEQ